MNTPNYSKILEKYDEHLTWGELSRLLSRDVRTLRKYRAEGRLAGIDFVNLYDNGLMATKDSVLRFLNSRATKTVRDYTPPVLSEAI